MSIDELLFQVDSLKDSLSGRRRETVLAEEIETSSWFHSGQLSPTDVAATGDGKHN